MHPTHFLNPRRWHVAWRASIVALGLLLPNFASAQGEPGQGEEPELTEGSSAFDGPIVFSPGWIHFAFALPESLELQFDGLAAPLSGYPGSLYFPETPIGPAALFAGASPTEPSYYLYAPAVGVWSPLSYDEPSAAFVGAVGLGTVRVTTTAVALEPDGPTARLERDGDGCASIFITAPCAPTTFKQFFTMERQWKGSRVDPVTGQTVQVGGVDNGPANPSGNAGNDVITDGRHVYVDAPKGDGDYPNTTPAVGDGPKSLEDAPNCNTPNALAAKIAARNPGVTVDQLTTFYRFTTYVLCDGKPKWKVEWQMVETNTIPGPTPDRANGDFSGRSQGPPPVGSPWQGTSPDVTAVSELDPHHATALTGFQAGNYGGAPAPGNW